jgi:FLVCR family MFS transporter
MSEPLLENFSAKGGGELAGDVLQSPPRPISPGRWYVLSCYTLVAALQGMGWVIPGTLAPNYALVYGTTSDGIQLLENYGCIFFILFAPLSMWAIDKYGSRIPVIVSVWVMALCALGRCLAINSSPWSQFLIQASAILDAIAGPVCMAAPTKIAEDWFAPHERTTATAISAMANQSGSVVVYLLVMVFSRGDGADMAKINWALMGLSCINLIMVLAYFPSLPPQPPSPSALVSREAAGGVTVLSLVRNTRVFFSNPTYVVCVLSYSLYSGLQNPAGALLTTNLGQLGASQAVVGWVGAATNLGSIVLGVMLARVGDWVKGKGAWHFKALLMGVLALGGGAFLLFSLCMPGGGVPCNHLTGGHALELACTCFVLGGSLLGVFICLIFDLALEHTFGMGPEASMLMGLLIPMNAVSMIALFMPASSLFSWVNYSVAGSALLSLLAVWVVVPQGSPRLQYDLLHEKEENGGKAIVSLQY